MQLCYVPSSEPKNGKIPSSPHPLSLHEKEREKQR